MRYDDCDSSEVRGMYTPIDPARDIPVVVHVVSDDDGAGGLPEAEARKAVLAANQYYEPIGMRFVVTEYREIQSTERLRIETRQERFEMYDEFSVRGKVNVFFVEYLYGVSGAATFPHYDGQGIHVTNESVGDGISTLAHELGHYFNLLHTHTDSGGELVARTNCSVVGDLLCDTPADPGPSWLNQTRGCIYDSSRCSILSCGVDTEMTEYAPNIGDIMSYYPDSCNDRQMSNEQQQMALCTLARIRTELAGVPDAGVPDAGVPDAGVPDARTPECELTDFFDFYEDTSTHQYISNCVSDCAAGAPCGSAPYQCGNDRGFYWGLDSCYDAAFLQFTVQVNSDARYVRVSFKRGVQINGSPQNSILLDGIPVPVSLGNTCAYNANATSYNNGLWSNDGKIIVYMSSSLWGLPDNILNPQIGSVNVYSCY